MSTGHIQRADAHTLLQHAVCWGGEGEDRREYRSTSHGALGNTCENSQKSALRLFHAVNLLASSLLRISCISLGDTCMSINTHCHILQLQHTATAAHCCASHSALGNTCMSTESHCNTLQLQHTTAHCNCSTLLCVDRGALQHSATATQYNTLQS